VKAKPNSAWTLCERIVRHVNRKQRWHVTPADPNAYKERGKFLTSSYAKAAFYGRPLDEPQKMSIARPLVGDENTIASILGIPTQYDGMTLEQVAVHDAKWRNAALRKAYDSILLMAPRCFAMFKETGKLPRSLELNMPRVTVASGDKSTASSNVPRAGLQKRRRGLRADSR
jgi:hypothetical protein